MNCSEKACPWPAIKNGLCRDHQWRAADYLTLPTKTDNASTGRSGFRMKQYAWSELSKFLKESPTVH